MAMGLHTMSGAGGDIRSPIANRNADTIAATDTTTPNENTDLSGPRPNSYIVPSSRYTNAGFTYATAEIATAKRARLYHVLALERI